MSHSVNVRKQFINSNKCPQSSKGVECDTVYLKSVTSRLSAEWIFCRIL